MMKKYGDLMACYMYIEDEQQDWKLNNLKSHPPPRLWGTGDGVLYEQATPKGLVWDWLK